MSTLFLWLGTLPAARIISGHGYDNLIEIRNTATH